jgi:hypothetical protein
LDSGLGQELGVRGKIENSKSGFWGKREEGGGWFWGGCEVDDELRGEHVTSGVRAISGNLEGCLSVISTS